MLRIFFFSFVCYYQLHFNTCCINYIFFFIMWWCFFLTKYSLNGTVSCCKLQCVMLDFHHNLQITDRTILDKQVVHETLYKLWKDEYIDSEVLNTQHFFLRQAFYFILLKILPRYFGVVASKCFPWKTNSLLIAMSSVTNFNDVKEVNWFSMSSNSASLDSIRTFSQSQQPLDLCLCLLWINIVKQNEWVGVKEDMIIYFGCFFTFLNQTDDITILRNLL